MPMSMLAGDTQEIRSQLLYNGAILSAKRADRDLLTELLSEAKPVNGFTSINRCGWFNDASGSCFVLPQQTIPSDNKIVLSSRKTHNKASAQGTLDDWKKYVGDIAVQHSRLQEL